jgi:hypothetical protein
MKEPKKKKTGAFGATPPPAGNEKKRIMIMSGALLVLLVAFVVNMMNQGGGSKAPRTERISTPKIKLPELHRAELGKLVKDSTEAGRSSLEPGALDLALDDADLLAEPHYNVMDTAVLDAVVIQALQADPSAARLKPLRLRGYIESMRSRRRANDKPYTTGVITLDDGSHAFFAVSKLADAGLDVGRSVRLDGLFVKLLREEVDGTWYEGPLVAGREMVRSFPALYVEGGDHGPFTDSDLANIVTDDIDAGVSTLPFEQKWKIMARAALLEPDEINWSEVPVLDAATLSDILENGDAWRGQPIRLPLDGAALMTSSTSPAEENPARLEVFTEGWLADNSWINLTPAIMFLAPFAVDIPDDKDPTVLGRGFLFKNLAYRSSGTGVRLTPVLILSELSPLPRPDERVYGYILAGVAGISILLVGGIFLLLLRDKKRSLEFQAKRRARARERRNMASPG